MCWGRENGKGSSNGGCDVTLGCPVDTYYNSNNKVKDMFFGAYSNCLLLESGHLHCWGGGPNTNDYSLSNISNPVGRTIVDLTMSHSGMCALLDNNSIVCMGSNSLGEFGNGQTSSTANHSWNFVPNLDPEIIDLGSYRQKFCALNSSGSLLCWGVTNYYAGSTYQSTATQIEHTVNSAPNS